MMNLSDKEIRDIFHQKLGLQELPISFYLVRPDGTFLIANEAIRCLLQIPPDVCIEDIKSIDFYANPADRERVLEKAIKEEEHGGYLERELIELRVDGLDLYVEDFCRPLFHPDSKEPIGYYGCLVDRTKEISVTKKEDMLQARVAELTEDIGNVLHANGSVLLLVKKTLDPTLQLLAEEQGMDPERAQQLADEQGLEPDRSLRLADEEQSYTEQFSLKLAKAIHKLLDQADQELREKALRRLRWDFLQQIADWLDTRRVDTDNPLNDLATLRRYAASVVQVMKEVKPGFLSKELMRDVQRSALDVQRADVIGSVVRANQAVIQMEHTLQALREYITTGTRPEEKWQPKKVAELVDRAIAELNEFAISRQVEIIKKNMCPNALVVCRERELFRAFANVLHNAIKYSWFRQGVRRAWVTIDIHCSKETVYVRVEDWGVPIPRDEIENGSIFQLGYRGRLSVDRNRLGTGLGLTDALKIAQLHNGNIKVMSKPASTGTLPEDDPGFYEQPFITVVEFSLPRALKKRGD